MTDTAKYTSVVTTKAIYTKPYSPTGHHKFEQFCAMRLPNYDTHTQLECRRVDRADHQVQIEIWITQYKGKMRKQYMTHGSLVLTNEDAEKLAMALLGSL